MRKLLIIIISYITGLGTEFWGNYNPDWRLCSKGKRQSPVNIETDALVFDPLLPPLQVDKSRVHGFLTNNGHSVVFHLNGSTSGNSLLAESMPIPSKLIVTQGESSPQSIDIVSSVSHIDLLDKYNSAGDASTFNSGDINSDYNNKYNHVNRDNMSPVNSVMSSDQSSPQAGISTTISPASTPFLSTYQHHQQKFTHHTTNLTSSSIQFINISGGPLSYSYAFDSIHFHYGRNDQTGSEHQISGLAFPAEVQIIGFNSDLYSSVSVAAKNPNGLVSISLLMQIAESTSESLKPLTSNAHRIRYRGDSIPIQSFSIGNLIQDSEYFTTYEGSLTVPGCYETVTWIVSNKPLHISRSDLASLRKLMQGSINSPKAHLSNNFRPIQALNQRILRTNIDFRKNGKSQVSRKVMRREMKERAPREERDERDNLTEQFSRRANLTT